VSLDFRGPPLPLPGEAAGPEEARPPEGLRLDTSELGPSEAPDEGPDPSPLALDLAGLESVPPPPVHTHDAWIGERVASVPPRDGDAPAPVRRDPSYSDLPPVLDVEADPASSGPEGSCGDVLGLVDRSRSSTPPNDLASEMRDRYALDDFSGSLRAAELLLGRQPEHPEARRYADSSRQKLEQLYTSRLGGPSSVPTVTVNAAEVRWLGIDHRAGFLLSRIDGETRVEDILDMSCMPRLEALKLLSELLQAGAIRIQADP
jgi:hypothetical protein